MPDLSMSDIVLHTERLSKSYAGLRANHNLDLQLRRGEIHALIGPNGAGKSTALAQLSGELQPSSGRIFFNGEEITGVPVYQRARMGIARSFQVSSVFDSSFLRSSRNHSATGLPLTERW